MSSAGRKRAGASSVGVACRRSPSARPPRARQSLSPPTGRSGGSGGGYGQRPARSSWARLATS
eukprot:15237079-Alexandrium_andersonii.AAC.1